MESHCTTTILEGAVNAVLLAFSVVVGAALETFLKHHPTVREQRFQGWRHELFYWSALTFLITLAIRFLVGSAVHLHFTYVDTSGPFRWFLKDLFFLFVFGAFLVRAALAVPFRSFVFWLMMFSGTSFVWSGIELLTRPGPLARSWCWIDGFQLIVTLACWWFVPQEPGARRNIPILSILVVVFAVLFCVDLWHILVGSGLALFS